MNKLIPITVLAGAILGAFMSLIGVTTAFLSIMEADLKIITAPVLFIGCVICSVTIVLSIMLKHRLCRIAFVIDIFACLLIAVGFIISFAV